MNNDNNKHGANTGKSFDDEWKSNMSKSHMGIESISTRKFDSIVEKEICRLYTDDNMSAYALAKKFDCYSNLITSILKRNNIVIKQSNYTGHSNGKNIFTNEQELSICKEYSNGNISMGGLAKKYSCASNTIRNILMRKNII